MTTAVHDISLMTTAVHDKESMVILSHSWPAVQMLVGTLITDTVNNSEVVGTVCVCVCVGGEQKERDTVNIAKLRKILITT